MGDVEDTMSESEADVNDEDNFEDNSSEIFGEKSNPVSDTIGGNLSGKRVQTSTILEETSRQLRETVYLKNFLSFLNFVTSW